MTIVCVYIFFNIYCRSAKCQHTFLIGTHTSKLQNRDFTVFSQSPAVLSVIICLEMISSLDAAAVAATECAFEWCISTCCCWFSEIWKGSRGSGGSCMRGQTQASTTQCVCTIWTVWKWLIFCSLLWLQNEEWFECTSPFCFPVCFDQILELLLNCGFNKLLQFLFYKCRFPPFIFSTSEIYASTPASLRLFSSKLISKHFM